MMPRTCSGECQLKIRGNLRSDLAPAIWVRSTVSSGLGDVTTGQDFSPVRFSSAISSHY